jgi:hypothetical protein
MCRAHTAPWSTRSQRHSRAVETPSSPARRLPGMEPAAPALQTARLNRAIRAWINLKPARGRALKQRVQCIRGHPHQRHGSRDKIQRSRKRRHNPPPLHAGKFRLKIRDSLHSRAHSHREAATTGSVVQDNAHPYSIAQFLLEVNQYNFVLLVHSQVPKSEAPGAPAVTTSSGQRPE